MEKNRLLMLFTLIILMAYISGTDRKLKPYLVNQKTSQNAFNQGFRIRAASLSNQEFIVVYMYQKDIATYSIDLIGQIFNFNTSTPKITKTIFTINDPNNGTACDPSNSSCIPFYLDFSSKFYIASYPGGFIVLLNVLSCTAEAKVIVFNYDSTFNLIGLKDIDSANICFTSIKTLSSGNIVLVYQVDNDKSSDIKFIVFDQTFTEVSSGIVYTSTNKIELFCVADSQDGGFVVFAGENNVVQSFLFTGENKLYKTISYEIGSPIYVYVEIYEGGKALITWNDRANIYAQIVTYTTGTIIINTTVLAKPENYYTPVNKYLNFYNLYAISDGYLITYRAYYDNNYELFYKKLKFLNIPNNNENPILPLEGPVDTVSTNIGLNSPVAFVENKNSKNDFTFFWFDKNQDDTVVGNLDFNKLYLGKNRVINSLNVVLDECNDACLNCLADGTCSKCPNTFIVLDRTKCTCDVGYKIIANQCKKCSDLHNYCTNYSDNCACTTCEPGYHLTGEECTCDDTNPICKTCKNPDNCLNSDSQCNCLQCDISYSLQDGKCFFITNNFCLKYDDKGCALCISTASLNPFTNDCECPSGHYYNNDIQKCLPCDDPNCNHCTQDECLDCYDNFVLKDNYCNCTTFYFYSNGHCVSVGWLILGVSIISSMIGACVGFLIFVKRRRLRLLAARMANQQQQVPVQDIAITELKINGKVYPCEDISMVQKEENKLAVQIQGKVCDICMINYQIVKLECGSEIPHIVCMVCFRDMKKKSIKVCPFDRNPVSNLS
jgi:hypothetical protein